MSSASLMAVQFLEPTKNPSSLDQRIESGLANFPSWMKPDVARHNMTRRPRKNLPQAHLSRLTKKRDKTYYEDRYKAAFKVATLAANVSKVEKGKRGNGEQARRICAKKMHERHMARKVREGGLKTTGLDDKDRDNSSADGDIDDDDNEGGVQVRKSQRRRSRRRRGKGVCAT